MGWLFKKREGYTYADAIKIESSTDEEYETISSTVCDKCKKNQYKKMQGAKSHIRYVNGKFYDVLHCECQNCGHPRKFVFDIGELSYIKQLHNLADEIGEEKFETIANSLFGAIQDGITGKCPECGTPFALRIGQAAMGTKCEGCGKILKLEL